MIAKMLYVYSNTMESSTFIENKIGETKKKRKAGLTFLGLYAHLLHHLTCFAQQV